MEQQKIIILEFRTGRVLVLDYDPNIYNEPEDMFSLEEMKDLSFEDCEYMIVPTESFTIEFSP